MRLLRFANLWFVSAPTHLRWGTSPWIFDRPKFITDQWESTRKKRTKCMFLFLVCSVGFNFLSQTSRFGGILARDFTFGGSYLREFYADPNFFRIGKKAHAKTNKMHVFIFDFFPFLSNFRKKTTVLGVFWPVISPSASHISVNIYFLFAFHSSARISTPSPSSCTW